MTPEEEAEFIASGPVMERKVESFSAGESKLQFLAAASWRKSTLERFAVQGSSDRQCVFRTVRPD